MLTQNIINILAASIARFRVWLLVRMEEVMSREGMEDYNSKTICSVGELLL